MYPAPEVIIQAAIFVVVLSWDESVTACQQRITDLLTGGPHSYIAEAEHTRTQHLRKELKDMAPHSETNKPLLDVISVTFASCTEN